MSLISTNRTRLSDALLAFSWNEWAQLGVSAAIEHRSPWVQDPEALLLLTLEVGRDDPRLFDEVLDWTIRNEPRLSVRRLRSLCIDDADRALLAAALAYVDRYRRRERLRGRPPAASLTTPEPLFRTTFPVIGALDEAFALHGFERPRAEPSGKSQSPDLRAPVGFGLRLRELLGVGARAEVVRHLLTADAPNATAESISHSAGFAKRNVQEALTALQGAEVVERTSSGTDHRFRIDYSDWARLLSLDPGELPTHRDWPQLFKALRLILRWLDDPALPTQTDYIQSSRMMDLLGIVGDDLRYAGVVARRSTTVADAWNEFEELVSGAIAILQGDVEATRR